MLIKKITTVSIHHGTDGGTEVWIRLPDAQEMVKSEELSDLPDIIEMLLQSKDNPVLRDAVERAKIVYRLGKKNE